MDILVVSADLFEDEDILIEFLPHVIDDEKEKLLEFLTAIDSAIQDIVYYKKEKEILFFTRHKRKK